LVILWRVLPIRIKAGALADNSDGYRLNPAHVKSQLKAAAKAEPYLSLLASLNRSSRTALRRFGLCRNRMRAIAELGNKKRKLF